RDPEFVSSYMAQRERILRDGAIPAKYKILMTMIVDALQSHPDGVANIAGRARAAGASDAEIQEAVEGAYLFGGTPALVTAMNAFRAGSNPGQRAGGAGVATKMRCDARSSVWARISKPASPSSHRQSSTVYLLCTGKSRNARRSPSGPLSFITSRRNAR